MEHFRSGPRGRHLVLGNEDRGSQGDLMLTTSAHAYAHDVAAPLEMASALGDAAARGDEDAAAAHRFWLDLGLTNGFGYGRSVSLPD